MVASIHPVGIHVAQVLNLKLDERSCQLDWVSKALGEVVGLELKLAAQNVHTKLDENIHGRKRIREEQEADDDGSLVDKPKVGIQRLVVDKYGEECEDVEEVRLSIRSVKRKPGGFQQASSGRSTYLSNTKQASGMAKLPVTKLVREHSNDLLGFALLNQGIVDDNVLLPRQAKEVGVAVSRALTTINHVELVQRKVESLGQSLDSSLELARFQRREFVKQRQNGDRVNGDHEHLEEGTEHPEVVEELIASLLDDLEETSQNRRGKDDGEKLRLDEIRDEELGCLLVEPKLLLKDEGVVDRSGQGENLLDHDEGEDEDDGLRDFTGEAGGRIAKQQSTRPRPELGQDVILYKGDVLNLTPKLADETVLGLCAAVSLTLVEDFLGDLLLENLGGLGLLEDLVLAERQEALEEVVGEGEADNQLLPGK